jgi:hexosaminidase
MAQGTHLYFDHPQEPDPEERGLYWATRYIDTRKTFGFMPDNIYGNADFKLTGDPITQKDLDMHALEHVPLKKVKNVIGKILIHIFMPQP